MTLRVSRSPRSLQLLALPASAGAHTIDGLVHDERDVVLAQAPGTHARITADGTQIVLRRDGARVVEVLDLQGAPALKLDANGAWARKGAPILTVLAVATGAPDPRDPAWLSAGGGDSVRFHYPGTHGLVAHPWSVPVRVDGRTSEIRGAVERVARPPLAWAFGAGLAVAAGMVLGMLGRRRVAHALVGALAIAVVAISYGESEATGATPVGRDRRRARRASQASRRRSGCAAMPRSSRACSRSPRSCSSCR